EAGEIGRERGRGRERREERHGQADEGEVEARRTLAHRGLRDGVMGESELGAWEPIDFGIGIPDSGSVQGDVIPDRGFRIPDRFKAISFGVYRIRNPESRFIDPILYPTPCYSGAFKSRSGIQVPRSDPFRPSQPAAGSSRDAAASPLSRKRVAACMMASSVASERGISAVIRPSHST